MNQREEWGCWRLVSISCWWKRLRDLSEGHLLLRFKFALLLCDVPPQASVKRSTHRMCLLLSRAWGGGGAGGWRRRWQLAQGRLGENLGIRRRLGAEATGDVEHWKPWWCWEDVDLPPHRLGVHTNLYVHLC